MNDATLRPRNDTWHARIDSVVYHGMDWLCPPYSQVGMQRTHPGAIDSNRGSRRRCTISWRRFALT